MNASVQSQAQPPRTSHSLHEWVERRKTGDRHKNGQQQNVGSKERIVSAAIGAMLVGQGLTRRGPLGLAIAAVGGALAYRGTTGHCSLYQAIGVDSANEEHAGREREGTGKSELGSRVAVSFIINKSPEELYGFWRNFENLPRIMQHLKSVRTTGDGRSHWVAKAPGIIGGQVEWDAEITADEPNSRIAWRALPGGDIEHRGWIKFDKAPGDRGTKVRVVLEYHPPAGRVGQWIASIVGEEPEHQIREDLRNFKRMMEIGEVLTLDGQPQGTCTGRGKRYHE